MDGSGSGGDKFGSLPLTHTPACYYQCSSLSSDSDFLFMFSLWRQVKIQESTNTNILKQILETKTFFLNKL